MPWCSQCGKACSRDGACGHCEARSVDPRDAEALTGWTVVARFVNAAEAGYFANELDYLLGFEPRLDCREDFDAIQHHWRSGYVLSVPEPMADRARAALREALDSEPELRPSDQYIPSASVPVSFPRRPAEDSVVRGPGSAIKWGPLFLTLAAGSLVIWHGKKLPFHRAPVKPDKVDRILLRDVPGLRDSGWVQQRGAGRRELIFEVPEGGTLREDRDGDGIFERQTTVRVSE